MNICLKQGPYMGCLSFFVVGSWEIVARGLH